MKHWLKWVGILSIMGFAIGFYSALVDKFLPENPRFTGKIRQWVENMITVLAVVVTGSVSTHFLGKFLGSKGGVEVKK
jgi:hypothetical protein